MVLLPAFSISVHSTNLAFQAFWLVVMVYIYGTFPQLLGQRTVLSVLLIDADDGR